MAEDKNEDLSMEDILSSIKNILTEDENNQTTSSVPTIMPQAIAVEPEFADTLQDDEITFEDDILELSSDMMVANPADAINIKESSEEDTSSFQDVFSISAKEDEQFFDIAEDDNGLDVDSILQSNQEITETLSPFNSSTSDLAEDDYSTSEASIEPMTEIASFATGTDSDPFYAEDTQALSNHNFAREEFAISEPIQEESDADYTSPVYSPEEVIEEAQEITAEPIIQAQYIPAPQDFIEDVEVIEPITRNEPELSAQAEPDATDVSANIINNFAKMFAAKEPESAPAPIAQPYPETITPMTSLGEGNKTIADVVSDVVSHIVREDIVKSLINRTDYTHIAHEEIKNQTKIWLENNLPAIVELTVKKEIERVMAKVGS